MSIFLTQQVSYATKVEAFNNRGLTNQVSVRATDAGIYPISRSTLESRVRYEHLHDELPARLNGSTQAYNVKMPVYVNILPKFDKFHYEAPTLIVEMKSGGEVLHAFGILWSYADIGVDKEINARGNKKRKDNEDVDMGEGTSSKKTKVSYSFL